jgi:RNA polymerase sigma-70 factor (ECF subfamily)
MREKCPNDPAAAEVSSGTGFQDIANPSDFPEVVKASLLAARIADGDSAAEVEMVRLYEPGMRQILRARTDRPSDIDDLVNQVWMLALPKLRNGELNDLRALPAYLNTFTRRVARNYLRHSSRTIQTTNVCDFDQQASPNEEPDSKFQWREAIETVAILLDTLSVDRDRQILQRFLVHEEDKSDICNDLGLDTTHFNKILYRARLRFKELSRASLNELMENGPPSGDVN